VQNIRCRERIMEESGRKDRTTKEFALMREMAHMALQEDNLTRAIECFSKCIKLNPNNAVVWYEKGEALKNLESKAFEEAKYEEAAKYNEDALNCFEKSLDINPNFAVAWYAKGWIFQLMEKYEEAIKCYDKTLEIFPNYANALYHKATVLKRLGQHKEAIQCEAKAEKLSKLKPQCVKCTHKKSFMICGCEKSSYYMLKVDESSWCECFVKSPAHDQLVIAAATFTFCNSEQRNWEKAISEFEKAIELGLPADDEVEALSGIASCYWNLGWKEIEQGNYQTYEEKMVTCSQNENLNKSMEYHEKAFSLDARQELKAYIHNETFRIFFRPGDIYRLGGLYVVKSEAIRQMQGVRAAISYLEEKLELFPGNYIPGTHLSSVYLTLGDNYGEVGDRRKQILCYKKALEADTDYHEDVVGHFFKKFHEMAKHKLRAIAQDVEIATQVRSDLNKRKRALEKEIGRLRQQINDKLRDVGTTFYPLLVAGGKQIEDKKVHEITSQIKSLDQEMDNIHCKIQELKTKKPKGGLWNRLKDKVSLTAKTVKLELNLKSLRSRKEGMMLTLGNALYSCHLRGQRTSLELEKIWQIVDGLKENLKRKQVEHSELEEALKILDLYKSH